MHATLAMGVWMNNCQEELVIMVIPHNVGGQLPYLKCMLMSKIPCICCCSVAKSCFTLCDPMDCSTPGFPVLHCPSEFAQTHVLWVGDAIQPSYLLLPPSPPALHLSQQQGLFQWVSSWHQVTKVLELELQLHHQSFQWIIRVGFHLTGSISLLFKGLSRAFSSTTIPCINWNKYKFCCFYHLVISSFLNCLTEELLKRLGISLV